MQKYLSKNTNHIAVCDWTAAWKNKNSAPHAIRIIDDKKTIFREACMISVKAAPCQDFIGPDQSLHRGEIDAEYIAFLTGDYIEENNLFKRLPFEGIANHLRRKFMEAKHQGLGADMRFNGVQNPSTVEITLSQVDTAIFHTHWREAKNAFSFD